MDYLTYGLYMICIFISYWIGSKNERDKIEKEKRQAFLDNIARYETINQEYKADDIRMKLAEHLKFKQKYPNSNIWFDEYGKEYTLCRLGFKRLVRL